MKNPREVRRAIIFCVRAFLHRGKMNKLDAFFRQNELLTKLARVYPFVYEQPTRAFFYNQSTFDERVRIVEAHMQFLCDCVREEVLLPLYQRESFSLWRGPECMGKEMTAALFFDYGQRKEGLMSVILRLGKASLYQIIFWIAPAEDGRPAMWIGRCRGRIWRMHALWSSRRQRYATAIGRRISCSISHRRQRAHWGSLIFML